MNRTIRTLVTLIVSVILSLTSITTVTADAAAPKLGSRINPTAPWRSGGIVFFSLSPKGGPITEQCTIGAPWQLANGTKGFLAAGHCAVGARRKPYVIVANRTTGKIIRPVGTLVAANYNSGSVRYHGVVSGDLSFVRANSVSNRMFVGGVYSSNSARIVGEARLNKTTPFCFSGAKTGTHCGYFITSYNTSVTYADKYGRDKRPTTHLMLAKSDGKAACPEQGDSGGPFFQTGSGGIRIAGVLSGSDNSSGRCSIYFTPLRTAKTIFGGSMKA